MFLEQFPQQLVNGIILGSTYALLALGYTMVHRIIRLINLARGDTYMLGAFIGYYAISNLHMSSRTTLTFTMIVTACPGTIVEFLAYRPLHYSARIAALITAVDTSFFLGYGMVLLVDANARSLPQAIDIIGYKIGSVTVMDIQLLALIVFLVLIVALQLIVKKTKMGKAVHAVSIDSDATELMGIDVNSAISFTPALGSTLAGTAGMLIGLYYNLTEPLMGMAPGVKAFVAAVPGGIGIIPGATLGGFVIGILEAPLILFNLPSYRDTIVHGVLITILLVGPAGTLDEDVKEKM